MIDRTRIFGSGEPNRNRTSFTQIRNWKKIVPLKSQMCSYAYCIIFFNFKYRCYKLYVPNTFLFIFFNTCLLVQQSLAYCAPHLLRFHLLRINKCWPSLTFCAVSFHFLRTLPYKIGVIWLSLGKMVKQHM